MERTTETLVEAAKNGDRQALETLVARIQNQVFRLSFKMLGHPQDAEDAAQEIMIKVVTHLGDFRGDSAFTTWVFRIASNHLLTTRRRRAEKATLSFERLERAVIEDQCESDPSPGADQELMDEEIRVSCMQTILLCLDRDHRLAYILSEFLEFNSREGAEILGITSEAFRKRLSRSRERVRAFLVNNCSLVNSGNPCRCIRQAPQGIKTGWIDPNNLLYAKENGTARRNAEVRSRLQELDQFGRVTALLRSVPEYQPVRPFTQVVKELMDSGKFSVLSE